MPSYQMISDLLDSRYERALAGSRQRIDRAIMERHQSDRLAIVRLEVGGEDGFWQKMGERDPDPDLAYAIGLFTVRDVQYLGSGERVVQLVDGDQCAELALQGHLQRIGKVAGHNYRMIAV